MVSPEHTPKHALILGAEVTLSEVVPYTFDESKSIYVFTQKDGTRRFATASEWTAGAEAYQSHARARGIVTSESPSSDKIALFRSLFRGREGAYARGWRKADGGIGYSPACANDRTSRCPRKNGSNPKVKCRFCPNRVLVPLTDEALKAHFTGESPRFYDVCGLYVLTEDSKTWILAADFDKDGWEQEVALYQEACTAHGLPYATERSRSGNGAHVWIFFCEPIGASLARNLGTALITWAMERSDKMSFTSYDRLFPTQDSLTEDGLGNPIALPFQSLARKKGNSVFIDKNHQPYPDQWRFLSEVGKVSEDKVHEVILAAAASPLGNLASSASLSSTSGQATLRLTRTKQLKSLSATDFPKTVTVIKANMLYVPKQVLTAAATNRVRRLAAFANPEFYRAQARHQSVYGKKRIIWCGEEDETHILLPRGLQEQLVELIEGAGAQCVMVDQRNQGKPIKAAFTGVLRERQQMAADALLAHEYGVLSAPTGFGKTVLAAYLIAQIKLRALVIVHTTELLDQWLSSLESFLDIEDTREPLLTKSGRPSKRKRPLIGRIGGGKTKPSGIVDVATYQSLTTTDDLGAKVAKPLVEDYDLVIFDECHHAAAATLECVMRAVRARRVYGLTATPKRQDGLMKIVFMHTGPIRYEVDPKEQAAEQGFKRVLIPRFTRVRMAAPDSGFNYVDVAGRLSKHEARTKLIAEDVIASVKAGRTPLVLTKFVAHAEAIARLLDEAGIDVFLLTGAGTPKEKRERMERLRRANKSPHAIVATDKYAGEGFNLPRLDTLMLAIPYSFEGTLTQYVGRLHRRDAGKTRVEVYDYVDTSLPQLENMYKNRLRTYAKLGYEVEGATEVQGDGATLVDGGTWLSSLSADLKTAEHGVRIVAPYASIKAANLLLPALKDAASRGVPIKIDIRKPTSEAARERLSSVIDVLQAAGCKTSACEPSATGIALVDGRISWYGTLPLIGMPKEGDCSLRVVSAEVAADIEELIDGTLTM